MRVARPGAATLTMIMIPKLTEVRIRTKFRTFLETNSPGESLRLAKPIKSAPAHGLGWDKDS
jgi:hypothetical protein